MDGQATPGAREAVSKPPTLQPDAAAVRGVPTMGDSEGGKERRTLLRDACCCVPLKTGTKAIAIVTIICSFIFIGTSSYDLSNGRYHGRKYTDPQKATYGQLALGIVFGVVEGLCGLGLLLGAIQGIVGIMLPWMAVQILLVLVMTVFAGSAINDGLYVGGDASSYRFGDVALLMVPLLILVHFLLVVHSFCQTLRDQPRASEQSGKRVYPDFCCC